MRSRWCAGVQLVQGYLVGGCLHFMVLHQAIGASSQGRDLDVSAIQDLQDDLIPYFLYYCYSLFALLLARVFVHAITVEKDARAVEDDRAGIPLRRRPVAILLLPWAPRHRHSLSLNFLGAGLASGVNLWWAYEVAYRQWPRFLGYTPGKYDWVLRGTGSLTLWYVGLLLVLYVGGLLVYRRVPTLPEAAATDG